MSIATTVGDALAFEEIDFKILRYAAAAEPADAARRAGISSESLAKAVLLKDPAWLSAERTLGNACPGYRSTLRGAASSFDGRRRRRLG